MLAGSAMARLGWLTLAGWALWSVATDSAHAQDVGIFRFFVNLQPKGDVFVRHERATGYWIKQSDMKAHGLAAVKGETGLFANEPHMRLNTLQDVILDVDDRELTISIAVKPELLGTQSFDLGTSQPLNITPSVGNSAHYNYRIGYYDTAGAAPARTLENQFNARLGGWLLQYQDSYATDRPERRYVRESTNLIRDWPESMQRLNIGDVVALSGELGTLRTLGGVSFSRVFETRPGFVSNPTARFVGTVNFPSTAEVYVDGVRIRTLQLNPGVFQLNNLDYYGGLRSTQIVIRDAYGNRQTLARSFYFSEQLLKAGLSDYSYNVGVERENVGVRSNDYSGAAYSAYHRYGLSDAITIGFRSDGNREAYSLGPLVGVNLGDYGTAGAGFSGRRNMELDTTGYARIARYSFESRHWSVRAQARHSDFAYNVSAADPASLALPRRDTLLGAGYNSSEWGSVSYDVTRSSAYDGTFRNAKTLGYSLSLGGQIQFFASVSRVQQDTGSGWEGFAGVNINLGGARNLSYNRQKVMDFGYVDTLTYAKSAPDGEGHGYRLTMEKTPDGSVFEPFGQLNTRHGIFTADGSFRTSDTPASPDRFAAAMAGALVFAGGEVALTRPVPSSFAVVKVGELPDVRVLRNNQEAGRTDERGVLVMPNLTSYAYNTISIAPQDVPLEYEIAEVQKTLVPGLGSGVLASFAVRQIRAYEGRFLMQVAKREVPVEHTVVTLAKGETILTVTTGYGGEFYLDGAEPGEYRATFTRPGSECRFALLLPPAREALTRLSPIVVTCEPLPPL